MKIDEMALLIRVAETGSMTLAAQQLHLTPAAVSAAVLRIEENLGLRLFERTTRSLHPTDEGLVVLDGCKEMGELWQRTLDSARGQSTQVSGTVHISAPTDTTYQMLESIVVEVCKEHPGLRVILDGSDVVQHLHRDAIDIAIRYGQLQDSALKARKLAHCPGILVAAPSYLDEWGTPETPEDLQTHRCLTLQLANTPMLSWQLERDGTDHSISLESPLCGDGYITRRWAISGMGIAFKSLFDVIDDLEAGRLVRILPTYTGRHFAVHIVFPSRRFVPARIKVLDEALTTHLTNRAKRCEAWLTAKADRP